ncbi:MAG: efflux RND transporter periplasmic adaptor subunit [Oceanospirillaceae bacterium]
MHKQSYRGKWWYVLQDPYNNQFFRIPPKTYQFIAQLTIDQDIEQTWQQSLINFPDETPGQQDVIQLLTQLHHHSLLEYDSVTDNAAVFDRQEKLLKKQFRSKLLGFMFIKVPLFDPDDMLVKFGPVFKLIWNRFGLFLWLAFSLLGIKIAIDHSDNLMDQTFSVLAPSNLLLLYFAMAGVKAIHELSHSFVCRHYGGEVHTLGIMFIIFIPLPYMDATSSWAFRHASQRILVAAAGMIVELFIAVIAIIIWANTGQGVTNSLAYNIIFIASVSTVLFNANPLLRFDAYYMLCDALSIPNLYQRSRTQITYLIEKLLFGVKHLDSAAYSLREAVYLVLYAILSSIYKVIIFVGIFFFVADKYLILGWLMALFSLSMWIIPPPIKLIKYLSTNQRIARRRKVAIRITCLMIASVIMIVGLIPFSNFVRVSGIIESVNYTHLNSQSSGYISKIFADNGQNVTAGTALFQLENTDIADEIQLVKLSIKENLLLQQKVMRNKASDLSPLQIQHQSLQKSLSKLHRDQAALTILAPINGLWFAPQLKGLLGTWVMRGSQLGSIYDPTQFRFSAVVLQDDNSLIFQDKNKPAQIRISGQESYNIQVESIVLQDYFNTRLPSAALGWSGGGELNIDKADRSGTQSKEPFFHLYATLPFNKDIKYNHGVSGVLRLQVPSQTLLSTFIRELRQTFQKRFQI